MHDWKKCRLSGADDDRDKMHRLRTELMFFYSPV